MQSYRTRVGRWPLAFTVAATAACADEPVGLNKPSMATPNAATAASVAMVTTNSGGKETGSLRWAARQSGATVRFDPSLAGDTITVDSTVYMDGAIAIEGPADKGVTIKARFGGRVIHIPFSGTLRNVTITGGSASQGAAVFIDWQGSQLILDHTTVRGNQGTEGVIFAPTIRITNSTVSGNTATIGAAITYRTLELVSSTVAFNGPAAGIGGQYPGPYQSPAFTTLRNSIVASNGSPMKNCRDTVGVYVNGPNLSNDNSCATSAAMIVANPDLGALANNGGPSMTHRLGDNSAAINAGVYCDSVDQRYVPRDAKCDLGAFEFTDFTIPTMTVNATVNFSATSGIAVVTGTVRCNRSDTFTLGVQLNQTQKSGKDVIAVRGSGYATVNCTTTAQPWTVNVTPWGLPYKPGSANAGAFINNPPVRIIPSWADKAVKMVRQN